MILYKMQEVINEKRSNVPTSQLSAVFAYIGWTGQVLGIT